MPKEWLAGWWYFGVSAWKTVLRGDAGNVGQDKW